MKYLCMASQPLSTPATPRLSRIVQEKAASALLGSAAPPRGGRAYRLQRSLERFLAGLCQIQLGKHTPHSMYQTKFLDVKLFNQAHCRPFGRQLPP